MNTVFLDGEFLPIDRAQVSVMDRGFLFGDGIYEVIPVYSRKAFRLEQHLRRLQASLDAIGLANPKTDAEWTRIVARMIEHADYEDQSLYLQITRGAGSTRNHAFPAQVRPTVFMMNEPLSRPTPEQHIHGVAAVTAADIRWLRCDVKAISLLANCLLRQMAVASGCVETVLLRDGFLTEGAASNIFVVKNGTLLAPIKNHLMLPGITYDVVLEIAAQQGLPYEVRDIREAEVRTADEVWMTSSTKEVLAIVRLDDKPVGSGVPGPAFARMHAWYQQFKADVMRG